jgi:cytochrome P450
MGDTLGKGLLNMDDPEHARHRKMWNPAFTSASMEAYLPVIQRVIAERTRTWPQRGEVDVYHEAREITFDAAAAALAGFRTGAEVDHLRDLFYTLLHGFDPERDVNWESFLGRALLARDELAGILRALIAERRAMPEEQQPHDVVGMIVRARDESGAALSDEQLLAHINILLVAGHETTTTLSAWVLYLLATQPEQRRRVEAELAALLGDSEGAIPVEAVRAMKLLDNFIKEAGRLYSPVVNVPRGVVADFEFGGYRVPAGTPVRLALAAGHRLPHIFADPDAFDPDRFAPPREEDRRFPYALVTFGGGPRICIGINFANIETKIVAAHVLRNYRLEPVEGQRLVHAGHWNAAIPGGIRLRVRAR